MNNEQIKLVAEKFKSMFTEEELKIMEDAYNQILVKKEMEAMLSGSSDTNLILPVIDKKKR